MRVLFRSAIWPFRLVDLAFQVGRGLVPLQPCFGVLKADIRESTGSPQLCPPPAGKAEGNGSWDAHCSTPKRIRRGQAPNGWASPERLGKPRTAGQAPNG